MDFIRINNEILKKSKLIPFKNCINKNLYEMYQDIPKEEVGSINRFYGLNFEDFEKKCNEYVIEENIINEKIGSTTKRFILSFGDSYIGEIGIRTTLNDFWINKGSQIYYKIRFNERNKGFGNIILNLALKELKKMGWNKVRINCNDKNIASKKIIIKNGGIADIKSYKTKDGYSSSYIIILDKK